jgi:anti-sigma factor ChrR (cupin superfamily)
MRALRRNRLHRRHSATTFAYAAQALAPHEAAAARTHLAACPDCQRELERLREVVQWLAAWPTDIVRPPASLQERLARRIAEDRASEPMAVPAGRQSGQEWRQVALGIHCKLLANDSQRRRVSMLVRLAPGASYPPHTHAGVEELHLLDGELRIDERRLLPGDYHCAPAGSSDRRVFSGAGCTCLLVTSTQDILL